MMLALLILVCLVASVIAAAAVRSERLPRAAAVLSVSVLPLGAWLLMQLSAEPARSSLRFEVLGQWHRIGDTLRFASDSSADVRLREGSDVDAAIRFVAAAGDLEVRVRRSAEPVLVGDRPVNARSLDRRAVVRSGADSVVVIRPLICFRCDTRFIEHGAARTEVRLADLPRVTVAGDTLRLFRVGGATWIAGQPGRGVTVDGDTIPSLLVAEPDSVSFGVRDAQRMLVLPVPVEGRIEVRLRADAIARWVLPQTNADSMTLLVSATVHEPLPGTLPVLNPGAAAPGAAREPYGGALQLRNGAWHYIAGGVTTEIAPDRAQLLPRMSQERRAGHIVRLQRYDMDPARARWAVLAAWLGGALTLAMLWRHLHVEPLAPRVALLGFLSTLAAVRAIVAFRAWLAPPHDGNSPQTLLALLIAIPAFTALLHLWRAAAESPRARTLRREATLVLAPVAVAFMAVLVLAMPAWRLPIAQTVIAALLIGAGGLVLLNRLLLGSAAMRRDPLAAATSPAQQEYTYRQFVAALVLLAMLGFLLVVLMQLLRYGALVAFAAWGVILCVALFTISDPGVVIRRRSRARPFLAAALAGGAAGAAAFAMRLGIVPSVIALLAGGAAAWVIVSSAAFAVRPVRLRSLLTAPLIIAVAASLGAVLLPDLIGSLRVTAEYALALAGLVAVARIFSILWFRHTGRLTRAATAPPLPGILAVAGVIVLLIAAVYLPLVLFDQGLVLLFLAATVTAVAIGFHAMGARALAVGVPVALVVVFVAGMFVRPSTLEDGSASLSTAQIRYAATYHPRELERHLVTSPDARPLTTVRTLQQYWGIAHFAAGGTGGRGYFGSAYADWIVPRPVALTENVFSTFVLSEHGWTGAAAVLLCYLAIALALLYGAYTSVERATTAPRALLLAGIAAFWLVPALYIAGANGVLLPLTGQNMPMLGLLSRADVALACWLSAIGLCALPFAGTSGTGHVPSAGWAKRLRTGTLATSGVFATATVALIAFLWKPAHAVVGDFALRGVVEDVETLVAQGAIQTVPDNSGRDSLAIASSAAAHPYLVQDGFVRSRIARANAIARGDVGGGGCLDADALLRSRDDGGIAIFGALCGIRTTTRTVYSWRGPLVMGAAHTFVLSDGRAAIIVDPDAQETVALGSCSPAGVRRARAVRVGCDADAALVGFGTSAPVLETMDTLLTLNGAVAAAPTLLRHGDHLHGPGVDVWTHALPPGAVGYARWENGAQRRIVHATGTPWLAQVDSQLARGMAHAVRDTLPVAVTLHPDLQAHLHDRLAVACAALRRVRRCSAVIADPVTGAVLATAATGMQPHRFLPADPNLRNHPAASAIKPILAAAALHAYPQLRTLEVEHDGAEYDVVANTGVQPSLRAPRGYPAARIPLRGYLGASDNLYSATLGFLATSERGADGAPSLRGQTDQSRLVMNGRPLRGAPSWSGRGSLDLSTSPLAEALSAIYGVHVTSSVPPFERSFWEPAVAAGALVPGTELQRITPEPVGLRMDSFRSPRELTSFTIGGDRNRWNNVALVEAISRIYTGRAVRLHLLRSVGGEQLVYDAPEIAGFAARREVLDGMAAVTQEPWGTAYALRSAFPSRIDWRAKTGTLREREWVGSVFLFVGGGTGEVCNAAGVVTIEFAGDADPDGAATGVFRDAVAPLLRSALGWGTAPCVSG